MSVVRVRRVFAATVGSLILAVALPASALAVGELTQKAGMAACHSENGTAGACTDGVALDNAASAAVSPDGSSVYVVSLQSNAVLVFDRAGDGTLTQKAGVAGCISETGTGGACTDGIALVAPFSVAVSPDGASVYVASYQSDAVTVFDRAADGSLTQEVGVAGCVSETGTGGACTDGIALDGAQSVTVSPDGASVYVASYVSDAVVVFDRAADGSLTQKAGLAGCISETGTGGACIDGVALDSPEAVTVSPDGASVYVVSLLSDAVVVLDRAVDGSLTQKAGVAGCVSEASTGGACTDGVALDGAISLTVSPDGASVYVASLVSDAVVVFDRAVDGSLTQKAGGSGCVSETGTGGACTDGIALDNPFSVSVSPDGASVYVASDLSDAVTVFDRAADGSLTQKVGVAGCVSETGTGGACADGIALNGARSVTVSPDGASVYATSVLSDAVVVFDRVRPGADLAVTLSDAPDPVTSGSDVTYTVSGTNNGPGAATGVVASLTLPSGAAFNAAGSTGTCTNVGSTVTCSFGTVAVGASAVASVVVTTTQAGVLTTTATIDGAETDPVASNNSATTSTQVNAATTDGGGGGGVPIAPTVSGAACTSRAQVSAVLAGVLNPNGSATTYWFEYGTTSEYGRRTSSLTLTGSAASEVRSRVTGLRLATTYHYRLVAENAAGTVAGPDTTCRTLGTLAPRAVSIALRSMGRRPLLPTVGTVSGRVMLTRGVTTRNGCRGRVRVTVRHGSRVVRRSSAAVRANCTYSAVVEVNQSSIGARRARLRIHTTFLGNAYLRPRSSRVLSVVVVRRLVRPAYTG